MSAPLFADRIQQLYASFGAGPAVWTAVSQRLECLDLAARTSQMLGTEWPLLLA